MRDKQIENLINSETKRQNETLNFIASENFVSDDVLTALGSVFVNKYAEGYPHKRYYGGNSVVDELETLAQKRALKLFGLNPKNWSVNVQPYSGSPANLAVYLALVPQGEKIMGMRLDMGGHLTHGHFASATGKIWKQIPYGLDQSTEQLDYEEIRRIAVEKRPAIIVAGGTAYSRIVDFKKFKSIADEVGALLMVDMSHFAGLVAGKNYPSPFLYADIVTATTHKTLRGPRAAIIFSKKEYSEKIDKAVFPGLQGGPHLNQISAVAVAMNEATQPAFKKYSEQIVKNARAMAEEFEKLGWRVVSGGTDTHLFLIDTAARGIGGKTASDLLEEAGIIVNKNAIPFDTRTPVDPSGIRIGTPAISTRGAREKDVREIVKLISAILLKEIKINFAKKEVAKVCQKFPLI